MGIFLNEVEASSLLIKNGIPIIASYVCKDITELKLNVSRVNFPIVMKILSKDIQHKTDVGCVKLDIKNIEEAIIAFEEIMKNALCFNKNARIDGVIIQEMAKKGLEVIIGMKKDPQFGPVIMVGTGGIYVEVFKDIALRVCPIYEDDVDEMLMETKIYEVIQGARGIKYDYNTLRKTMLNLSDFVMKNKQMEEIDINPFFLYEEGRGGKGVDALIKVSM